jgi:hypothetical protein
MMHTWWIVRRFVAWAAKINEDHMPPIEYVDTSNNLEMLKLENVYDGKLINQMKNI